MIKIKYLCEYPGHISKLSQLWYESIGKKWLPNTLKTEVEESLKQHLNKESLPLTYIALEGDEPIGMCSLRSDDGLNSKYLPWLGSLCVDPVYRHRGIGKLLTQTAKEKAYKMGFKNLYLFTFEQELADWYVRDGWKEIDKSIFKGHPVIVLEI